MLIVSCSNKFDKEKFLSECQFSIEDIILSDSEEYDLIYSRQGRAHDIDSMYRRYHLTQDHRTNLEICRWHVKTVTPNSWGRITDSLLVDNLFARAIKSSSKKEEIIELILMYGMDKPYSYQKLISDVCLRPRYYVNDSLKYISLDYALYGNYYCDDYDIELVRSISREKAKLAAIVFGKESTEAYTSLYEYAQLTQFENGEDTSAADSLFSYLQTHEGKYQTSSYMDMGSDPLYLRYLSSINEGDLIHAADILAYLTQNLVLDDDRDALLYSETKLLLLYENASFLYLLGQQSDDPNHRFLYEEPLNKAIEESVMYLSPMGESTPLIDLLDPDYVFYRPIIDWMDVAYNTPSPEKAFDLALFLKGTSALFARDLIRTIKEQGDSALISYVDSLRLGYNGFSYSNMSALNVLKSIIEDVLSNKDGEVKDRLKALLSDISAQEIWKNSLVNTQDVYNALKPNETAIEIIRVFPFERDDYKYDALILNYGDPEPIRIRIGTGNRLKELIRQGHLYDSTSESFYNEIVRPIMSKVNGETVYLAADGLFSLINYSMISDKNGKRVCDEWNLIPCTSTKTICEARSEETTKPSSIALFGGLEYTPGSFVPHYSEDNSMTRDIELEGFGYLPATLNEVIDIDRIATSNNIKSLLYTGQKGTEKEFRSLSGKAISIIHIASHGFYFNPEFYAHESLEELSDNKNEALYRCGIMLSNSQDAWLNSPRSIDYSDGMLLGPEIANLDLLDTELVVLAACNTGLGDIASDGVLGLQMAFKRAGVKSLLMSLGKVDDEATAFFMTNFYEKLFSGEDKYSAYHAAINAMRNSERFSDPKYWSQFILID